jgi:demethoxyubiquinone hydroxylase (CLK1/Coq7/Cat5 family)
LVFSLERLFSADCYRAGDGVLAAWLQRRAAYDPSWETRLRSLFPKQRKMLQLERHCFAAGETGAVFIYRGVIAVAGRRGDAELLGFAARHAATEAEHLRLIDAWLPPRQRSRLLGPWKLAGWLTGALPALAGRRAVYATIAAVERFVDAHYQQQIVAAAFDAQRHARGLWKHCK